MERIPKGIYTPEFRAEAVKLVEMEGLSVDAAAKRLSGSCPASTDSRPPGLIPTCGWKSA